MTRFENVDTEFAYEGTRLIIKVNYKTKENLDKVLAELNRQIATGKVEFSWECPKP